MTKAKNEVKHIIADEYIWTYRVTYKDGTVEMYNLATMPYELIDRPFSRISTDDPNVYILYPK